MSNSYAPNWPLRPSRSIVTNRLVELIRARMERLLPWFDRVERDRRARRTEAIRRHAIAARMQSEDALASYRRVRIGR